MEIREAELTWPSEVGQAVREFGDVVLLDARFPLTSKCRALSVPRGLRCVMQRLNFNLLIPVMPLCE